MKLNEIMDRYKILEHRLEIIILKKNWSHSHKYPKRIKLFNKEIMRKSKQQLRKGNQKMIKDIKNILMTVERRRAIEEKNIIILEKRRRKVMTEIGIQRNKKNHDNLIFLCINEEINYGFHGG